MGDGTETERMLEAWGLDIAIEEVFSKTMDKRAKTTVEIEISTKKIARVLQTMGKTDVEIIGYLEDLEDDTEESIVLEEYGQSPYSQYIYVKFKDGLEICL